VADIFISYTSSDRDRAFWIAKELEALGHTSHVHEWEIKGGDDIYAWMEQRHDAADHVLCVVSDDYLKAPYSTLERNAALWQAAAKRPGFVLLVAVSPCRLPTLSDHIRRCELFGIPEDAARLRLREFMLKRVALATAAFPWKVFAVSNIPIRVPEHFLGREDSLAAIETALSRYEGRVAITALHGLRGVGKTTLAAAYAERHRGDYRATWWIRAQTADSLRADLVGLGARLGWVADDEKEERALAAIMERLRNEGEGVLLIYDNAPDADALRQYLPRGGAARVLVTSNAHVWRGIAEPVEIRLWPKEIGADYLIARTGRTTERTKAEVLSNVLRWASARSRASGGILRGPGHRACGISSPLRGHHPPVSRPEGICTRRLSPRICGRPSRPVDRRRHLSTSDRAGPGAPRSCRAANRACRAVGT
jgi:TIR domain/NB-ARC domain